MTLMQEILSRRKLTTSIAAGVAAIAVTTGGYAIANSGSSNSAHAATGTPAVQTPPAATPGTGTIVTGTAADKAKAAALAAYPGGTVNRVVLLSNGEYNVHRIDVNWPHHVFVSQDFKVVGAE